MAVSLRNTVKTDANYFKEVKYLEQSKDILLVREEGEI